MREPLTRLTSVKSEQFPVFLIPVFLSQSGPLPISSARLEGLA